ncbi:MAG: hypothetical protein M1165_01915, partial [Candidatus Pacearchaeota archaeon]|nr:hypothetical protein [Candidatus Pacearchaeota archaeon]
LKVKLFMITRRKVHNSIKTALRGKAREETIKELENKSSETLFDELMKNQLQKELSLKLKKIYPLSACEIRVLEILKPLKVE